MKTIEIGALIGQRTFSPLQLRVMLLCGLVTFCDGFDNQIMALTVPAIAADWGVPHGSFGYVLAASLVGMAVGAGAVAPFGDRVGRKPMLVWSALIMSLATLAIAYATDAWHLAGLRFLAGVGIGVSVANSAAMISDYMPSHRRAAAVTLAYAVSAIGAIAAGALAPVLLTALGWRGIYMASGLLPLLLVLALALWLPESIRLLIARRPADRRIGPLLSKLRRAGDTREVTPDPVTAAGRGNVSDLVAGLYLGRTLTLWSILVLNSFVVYLILSWLPTLLVRMNWSQADALHGAAAMQFGGLIGALAIAALGRRLDLALIGAFAIAAVSLALMSVVPATPGAWAILLVAVGLGTSGSACGLIALSAVIYPTDIRATGVGWALLIGRFGAIAAPIAGGALINADLATDRLVGALAAPILVCALIVGLFVRRAWQTS